MLVGVGRAILGGNHLRDARADVRDAAQRNAVRITAIATVTPIAAATRPKGGVLW